MIFDDDDFHAVTQSVAAHAFQHHLQTRDLNRSGKDLVTTKLVHHQTL